MPRNRLDRPKFVQLHPDDDGFKLDPVFYGDPKDFVPKLNVYGEAFGWGLRPHDSYEDVDISRIMGRVQYSQMIYDRWEPGPPENQFVNALAKKKSEALFKVDIEGLCHCDYILNIVMPEIPSEYKPWSFIEKHEGRGALGPNLISRRCKVSGGINLDTFQDKVLQPLMGWDRNSHAFVFTDLSDGASFGPRGCSTIDMMYRNGVCYEFLPADDYVLAHLARKKGDVFEYFYDFGDHWYHRIEVEEIIPRDQSDGAVVVLGGNAMCPPENARGNRIWASKI
ncbi:hypothetical protein SISSUDRAFT_362775 [Sistotremastrum suecicum HHB10207 ss-3]|uniref:Plasmid pRiA4b Orf3-like domain-containing protein n=1 Tax=Sistotremastrum suecicum HHB10207 ss-3 TaxID=1314776 RepID=A0A165Z4U4_9AGAM|nr:hypothetical protein SISSUDRAFT_362775 [Sistotremastrum suecicum HHB10207 ss-3]